VCEVLRLIFFILCEFTGDWDASQLRRAKMMVPKPSVASRSGVSRLSVRPPLRLA
jgi:hypothetical protein